MSQYDEDLARAIRLKRNIKNGKAKDERRGINLAGACLKNIRGRDGEKAYQEAIRAFERS